jgi:DNA-binding XRE family transcriptional regulator
MEKDYLDELIEMNVADDPEFAKIWAEREAACGLAGARKAAGLTQQPVTDRMGVKRERLAELEKEPGKVSFARVTSYADAIGMTLRLEPKS